MAKKKKQTKKATKSASTSKKTKAKVSAKAKKKNKKVIFERTLFEDGFWRKNLIGAAILFILGLGLYLRTIPYEYVLDDQIVITKNTYTQKGFSGIWDILTTESFQGYFQSQKDLVVGARYRPLSIVTFAMEYGIVGGFNRHVSHFINALLYGLAALLLFRVLSLLFGMRGKEKWYLGLGFGAALLWTLHPLHTEAVANIKGRDEIMTLIGSLAALYYSLRYVEKGKILSLVLACVCFFLGLLSKESTITFLGVIPVSIYFFQTGDIKKILKVFAPLFGVFILYLIMRYQIIGYLLDSGKEVTDLMNNPFVNMNGGQKYATIFLTLLLYLKLCFVPYPLTHDYYPFHIPTMEWTDFLPILSLLAYVGMGIYALWGIRKRHIPSYAILFYIMTLSIVSNLFFPIGTFMNERFVFIASIGACILMAYILMDLLPRLLPSIKPVYGFLAVATISLAYGLRTFQRIPAWKSPVSLNASAIKVSKNSARANCFMGTALFNEFKEMTDPAQKKATLDKAAVYIRRSKELFPEYHNANLMLAGVVTEEYKNDRDFDKLLAGLTSVATDAPTVKFLFEYFDYLETRSPDPGKLVDFYHNIGKNILVDQKYQYALGIKYLEYGLRVDPSHKPTLSALASTYEAVGNTNKAQEYYNRIR